MAFATTTAAAVAAATIANSHVSVSLVLKPSNGSPFADFILGDDLHIGILDHTHALVTSFYPGGILSEPLASAWPSGIILSTGLRVLILLDGDKHLAEIHPQSNQTVLVMNLTLDLKAAPSVSEMAECLEDQHSADTDRAIDSCGFLREQFDIFKHDYREAFDNHGHETLANLTLSPALKKDVVNTLRRLQRAKVVIDNIDVKSEDRKFVTSLSEKIQSIEEELERVVRGKTEFSASNVTLPEFDADAISALFGHQNPDIKEAPAKNVVEKLCDFNQQFTEKVNEVLGAAELLLNEYTEFEEYAKKYFNK